jgi:hypothetical protein
VEDFTPFNKPEYQNLLDHLLHKLKLFPKTTPLAAVLGKDARKRDITLESEHHVMYNAHPASSLHWSKDWGQQGKPAHTQTSIS